MQAGSKCRFRRVSRRFYIQNLLLVLWVLLLPQAETRAADEQQTPPMSPSVVLVLKLVSNTHVKPTTGFVVSDDGLVLVPADFTGTKAGDEIVVLDGGTDILRNGRPAKVINRSGSGEFTVLKVEGLNRPGFTLSDSHMKQENKLHLEAFPPAEYIAKGAEPLWVPIEVSAQTPLPYVNGAIIDDCGYLAGLSRTNGTQNLEPGRSPVLIFTADLRAALDSMQISLPVASCGHALQTENTAADTTNDDMIAAEPQVLVPEHKSTSALVADIKEALVMEPSVEVSQSAAVVPNNRATSEIPERQSIWRRAPLWLPLLGVVILGFLIWKSLFWFRLSKPTGGQTKPAHTKPMNQSASEEPDTAELQAGSDPSAPQPRSIPLDESQALDMNAIPPGCNGFVKIEGLLDADIRFERFCAVDTQRINIVIGRGESDISIEHPAISRTHARIECDAEHMTLSDLGSSNGTFIRGIPCLAGEVLFINDSDDIALGDVRVRVMVISQAEALS